MIKQNCAARVLDVAQLHGFRADMVANDHEIDHGIVLEPGLASPALPSGWLPRASPSTIAR